MKTTRDPRDVSRTTRRILVRPRMPDPSSPQTSTLPPPSVRALALARRASLDRVLRSAGEDAGDLIDTRLLAAATAAQPVVEHRAQGDGEVVVFPLVATDAGLLSAMFSVPLEQAWALLPATERLVPLRVTPRRAAVLFFAAEVRRSSYGAHRVCGAAVPVLLDGDGLPPPAPPPLWRHPAIGFYGVELPVDVEAVARAGGSIMGLPHVVGHARLEIDRRGGRATFAVGHAAMASLEVRLGRWAPERRHDLSFQAYSLLNGRIVRTAYTAVGHGYRGRRGVAATSFGDHRRAQRIGRLELSRRPLELRVLPRVNWVAGAPADAGPI